MVPSSLPLKTSPDLLLIYLTLTALRNFLVSTGYANIIMSWFHILAGTPDLLDKDIALLARSVWPLEKPHTEYYLSKSYFSAERLKLCLYHCVDINSITISKYLEKC